MSNNYERICNLIKFVRNNFNNNCKYFQFQDSSTKFIVDGSKLTFLPADYFKHSKKDEFLVCVNVEEKIVMYLSYDCVYNDFGINDEHKDQEEGFFDWDKVEESLASFLVLNCRELTCASSMSASAIAEGYGSAMNVSSQRSYVESSASYKERQDFFDRVYKFISENKTAQAIDCASAFFKKKGEEKQFEDIDDALRFITFDKLNHLLMREFLTATLPIKESIKSRQDFLDKTNKHLMKIKPTQAKTLIQKFEPNFN